MTTRLLPVLIIATMVMLSAASAAATTQLNAYARSDNSGSGSSSSSDSSKSSSGSGSHQGKSSDSGSGSSGSGSDSGSGMSDTGGSSGGGTGDGGGSSSDSSAGGTSGSGDLLVQNPQGHKFKIPNIPGQNPCQTVDGFSADEPCPLKVVASDNGGHGHHDKGGVLSGTDPRKGGLQQIPSNSTDFPNNDPSVIQVHVATAKKDIIGSYHVTGEITNEGSDTLQFVQVTVHFYDAIGNLVADSTCCYTTPTDIDPGHTATFDSFAMSNQISGKPVSYRLSYDWNAPTVSQPASTINQPSSQSEPNFTASNMISAASQPTFGSALKNVLKQIPSTAADYPNKGPNSVKFLDVKAIKGGAFNYVHITGTLLSLSKKTLWYPSPIVYLFDKNNQSVGEVTNGLFVSTELLPHTSGTFDVDIDPSMLKAEPTSYQLRFTGTFQ